MFSATVSAWANRKRDTSGFLLLIFFILGGGFIGIVANPGHEDFVLAMIVAGCALILLTMATESIRNYEKRSGYYLSDTVQFCTALALIVSFVVFGGLAGLLLSQFLL